MGSDEYKNKTKKGGFRDRSYAVSHKPPFYDSMIVVGRLRLDLRADTGLPPTGIPRYHLV